MLVEMIGPIIFDIVSQFFYSGGSSAIFVFWKNVDRSQELTAEEQLAAEKAREARSVEVLSSAGWAAVFSVGAKAHTVKFRVERSGSAVRRFLTTDPKMFFKCYICI